MAIHGTRDFYPSEMKFREYLFDTFSQASTLSAFQRYETPVLERTSIWRKKQGDEIVKQLFSFTYREDAVEHEVCLRPELTPTLARLISQRSKSLVMPCKWFTIGQCWRLETVQVGRKREHYQWNVDIVGEKEVSAEAEVISVMVRAFKMLGLSSSNVRIKVSDRKIIERACVLLDVEDKFVQICGEIDKFEKIGKESLIENLLLIGLPRDSVDTLLSVISCRDIDTLKEILGDECVADVGKLLSLLNSYDVIDWIVFNPSIVRGLSYYTGIVFEAFDTKNKFRAIAGGGRYDNLMSIPACGFGFGDCVIEELLRSINLVPEFVPDLTVLVIPFNESLRLQATSILSRLRDSGVSSDIILCNKNMRWSFAYADRRGAKYAVLVAPDELARGCVKVKNLRDRSSGPGVEMLIDELTSFF